MNPKIAPDFGDGSDGDVNIVGNVLLTRSMSYNLLVVTPASILYSMGFKVRAKIKLTVDAGGFISAAGQPGAPGAAGSGGAGGLVNFTGTRLPEASIPKPGAAGADSGVNGAVPSVGGLVSAALLDPVAGSNLLEGRQWAGGGGAGGGSVGDGVMPGQVPDRIIIGAPGGNGGDAQRIAGNHNKGGGGGGGGGGKIDIAAQEIDNNGTITANGGIGGDGEGDANAQAGGGGGGGGGAIDIKYKTVSGGGLGTRTVVGGLGGASFGGVADGLPGAPGFSYAMKIGA
ncbi:MAG: hypothetical protein IMZ50_14930 [Candidatus Atribacteria bacterium]|nr:hypothetical protein [Candidatus Atribacteria bacterium]